MARRASELRGKARVFLSYSRKDLAFVSALKGDLDALGYETFVDTEQISGGEEWKRRIEQLIVGADAVVFVVSPDSVSSTICDWETKRAIDLSKRLIPIVCRELQDEQAPPQLADRNYIFFIDGSNSRRALVALCEAIDVDISWVREHTRVGAMAARWKASGERRDLLLRGSELTDANSWKLERGPQAPAISSDVEDYLAASERERRRSARQSRLLFVTFGVLIVLILAGAAYIQREVLEQRFVAWTKYSPFVRNAELLSTMRDGTTFQDCGEGSTDCPSMVIVPAGRFRMGTPGDGRAGADAGDGSVPTIGRVYGLATIGGALDETPERIIDVARFAVSQTEITYAQWRACVTGGGCQTQQSPLDLDEVDPMENADRDDRPAINVSWFDAHEYVTWLSAVTGADYRLLTEAEWEFAARGITSLDAPNTQYSWGNEPPVCDRRSPNGASGRFASNGSLPASANGCSPGVSLFQANPFGLYDMHGSVWEWVQDCYGERYDPNMHDARAFEPVDAICELRILRGGSWNNSADYLRSAYRLQTPPNTRNAQSGFRVARSIS